MPDDSSFHPNDHDLLIELRTEFRGLRDEVRNSNVTLSNTVAAHTTDISSLKLEVAQVKTGVTITRWIFGVLAGVVSLTATIYAIFFKP